MGCVCVKGMQGVPQEVISGGKIDIRQEDGSVVLVEIE